VLPHSDQTAAVALPAGASLRAPRVRSETDPPS